MKFSVLFLVLIIANSLAFAASAPTPTTGALMPKTSTDKLNLRIRHQMAQIQRETKLGKLSKDQSKSLKAQVEAIHKQELAFLKQDNAKVLTDVQVAQLNTQLDTLSKSIPIK
jgi:hypothetical protein